MNNKLDRLKDIKIENYIWIIYIGIIILSWYANSKERNYILYNNHASKKQYQKLMILIFTILLFVYYYSHPRYSFPMNRLQNVQNVHSFSYHKPNGNHRTAVPLPGY